MGIGGADSNIREYVLRSEVHFQEFETLLSLLNDFAKVII